jgi:hypothetical protein
VDWQHEFELYLREHRHPLNRACHVVGIPLLTVTAIAALVRLDWRIFVVGWTVGWALQLAGHRIEGNRPAIRKRAMSALMGPVMVAVEILEVLGLHFAFAERARRAVGIA